MNAIDWHNVLGQMANSVLPNLLKIFVQLVLIPIVGMGARIAAHYLCQQYFSFIVKWVGQQVTRGTEQWAEKRMDLAIDAASGTWWLKWMSKDDMHQYVEAAVAEWNKDFLAEIGQKP